MMLVSLLPGNRQYTDLTGGANLLAGNVTYQAGYSWDRLD